MNQELSKKLNDCGVKKAQIETLLKMPKNSLAGMMNGTRPTPNKWAKKLETFVGDRIPLPTDYVQFKGIKVLAKEAGAEINNCAADINSIPVLEEKTLSDTFTMTERERYLTSYEAEKPWVAKVEEYCCTIVMTPEELIADHKRLSATKTIKLQSKAVETIVKKGNDYNPNDNWRFKSKLGKKD